MRRLITASLILALSVGLGVRLQPADAEELFIAYMEGLVEYQQGGAWRELMIGDNLSAGSRVRLEDGAYLEVVVDRQTLRISQAGVHRLGSDAVPAAATTDTSDVRGLLSGAVRRFSQRDSQTSQQSVTAGVRASEAASDTGIDWAGDESPRELIDQGLEALADDRVDDASFMFEDAFLFAEDGERDEAGFWLVYSFYLLDERELALETLAEFAPAAEREFYPDYALVAAELLQADGAADEAARIVERALAAHPDLARRQPLAAQALHFTLGQLLINTDPPRAETAWRAAAEIAPGTQLAAEASRLLSGR